jgi:hypothetical protein
MSVNSIYTQKVTYHCWERKADQRILRAAGFGVMAFYNDKHGLPWSMNKRTCVLKTNCMCHVFKGLWTIVWTAIIFLSSSSMYNRALTLPLFHQHSKDPKSSTYMQCISKYVVLLGLGKWPIHSALLLCIGPRLTCPAPKIHYRPSVPLMHKSPDPQLFWRWSFAVKVNNVSPWETGCVACMQEHRRGQTKRPPRPSICDVTP